MRSIVVILDESAPSFCYYDPLPAGGRRMDRDVLRRVVEFSRRHDLGLQLVCGHEGLPDFAPSLLHDVPHTCYFPAGAWSAAPEDVPIVQAGDSRGLAGLAAGSHEIAVLRAGLADLPALPGVWEELSGRVYRVVLVMCGLDQFDEDALQRYDATLLALRQRLAARYLRGAQLELNVLSDRLALLEPLECGAGLDHLTVVPSGELFICPGFAFSGRPSVGDLEHGWRIADECLLDRDHAPICSVCDAFQCRRCVHVNLRATLEVNTPPWQVCRAAHREREASRLMLAALHERRCMEDLPPIAPLDYEDPLEVLVQSTRGARKGASARRRASPPPEPEPLQSPAPARTSEPLPDPRLVGRVTPAERDAIQELYFRKNGLAELLPVLARMDPATLESSPLYDRIVRDMGIVATQFRAWWDSMETKYAWRRERPDDSFRIDFETCEIRRE